MVSLLQRLTFEERESKQSASAPPLGASPRLGMPERRHCSVGRREGPSMAQRGYLGIHAEVPTAQYLRSAIVVNGAPRSTSTARRPSSRPGSPGRTPVKSVGAKLAREDGGTSKADASWSTAIASKFYSHRDLQWPKICRLSPTQCGSELAREGGVIADLFLQLCPRTNCGAVREGDSTVDEYVECSSLFASRLAPTGETRSHQESGRL